MKVKILVLIAQVLLSVSFGNQMLILNQTDNQVSNKVDNSSMKTIPASKMNIKEKSLTSIKNQCPDFENIYLTQSQLFERLINPCRYDKIQRPPVLDENGYSLPVNVYIRSYVFYIQNLDTQNLQFTLQMRFQIRYNDQRLIFSEVSSNRTDAIMGEEDLRKDLWMPHVFFVNEKNSAILGAQNRDIFTTIHSDGTVIISSRIHVSLYCSMEFKKFPLDRQRCKTTIGSWIYNSSDVKLHWETSSPFTIGADKLLTEYTTSMNVSLQENEIAALNPGLQYGDLIGNYSSIAFSITLDRSLGFYLLDYYIPSMMLVFVSWVSFWLQADQTSPRAMLGTTAMLAFITLSTAQTKTLPKVSYIKASEVWFIGCTLFIFGSLVEFAFVNLLWRRKKGVVLEEVTTVNILKKTLTPSLSRKNFDFGSAQSMKRSNSDMCLNKQNVNADDHKMHFNHRLSVNNVAYPVSLHSAGSMDEMDESNKSSGDIILAVPDNKDDKNNHAKKRRNTTLSHKEVAILLDKQARLVFPCAFLVFNIFYWIIVNV